MNKITLLTLIIGLSLIELSYGSRHFRLGRSKNGTLGAPAGDNIQVPPTQWFQQKVDHMNPADTRVFKQRYFTNSSFFDPKHPGPIFLMIGGEGPADPRWMVKGAWIEYAQKFNALCFMVEHRYYGESYPFEDLSVKNLQYLTSTQALADLAYFIHTVNEDFGFDENNQWIAFGGSYPGSLAAWLRLKYPHLVYAAVSSSGPLLAKVNFMEYFQVVVQAIREKSGGDECVTQIERAHKEIELLMEKNPTEIQEQFKVCKPFSNATFYDLTNFYYSIANDFADLVQYNEDNRIGTDNRYKNLTINKVCDMFAASADKAYKKLAAFNSIMLDKNNETCLDYSYDNMINELKNVSIKGNTGARQWMYQTCTEFGFYQTSSGEAYVFGNHFPLDFFVQQCIEVFGTKFNRLFIINSVEWTNNKYGALNLSMDRIIFVHGTVDPWHALGITSTQENNAPAIFIKGTAHCANMYPSSEDDSIELKEARVSIQQCLVSWIGLP